MADSSYVKLSVPVLIDKLKSGIFSDRIKILQGSVNPLKLEFDGLIYNIYLRNISHGGKSYPENTTRAQLPCHTEFDRIKESDELFLFLGYAQDSDVFVCWDPVKAKSRLNHREYVSFFSRKSIQDSAEGGLIRKATLSNGDIFVAFKRTDFEAFLNIIESFFPSLQSESDKVDATDDIVIVDAPTPHPAETDIVGMLSNVNNDPSIKLLIDSLSSDHTVMYIIAEVMKRHNNDYPNMSFKDWATIIRAYLK